MLELLFMWTVPKVIVTIVFIILVILFLIVIYLRGKRVVTVPSITLVVSPTTSVKHGDKVTASGIVYSDGTTPAAGETVVITLVDSAGNSFPGATVQSGTDGSYSAAIVVPGVAPGVVNVTAADTNLGVTATATFTFLR